MTSTPTETEKPAARAERTSDLPARPTLKRGVGRFASVFTKSALVGILATLLDWLVLLLVVWLGMPKRWAIVPACLVGIVAQFVGNQRLTFRAHTPIGSKAFFRQAWRFSLVEAGTLLLNWVVYNGLREWAGMDYRVSRVVAGFGVYVLFSLPMWHWVFAGHDGRH